MPAEATPKASLADYLAAERTLLAWIRTGLALMGFGFVLARFALFPAATPLVTDRPPAGALGVFALVGDGADHRRGDRECVCRMAPPATRCGRSIAATKRTRGLHCRRSRLLSFSGLSGWRWRSISSRSGIPLIQVLNTVRRQVWRSARIAGLFRWPAITRWTRRREAQGHSAGEGSGVVCAGRSQRRGRKGGDDDAPHEAADLRESKGGHSADAGRAQRCDRSAAEDSGRRRTSRGRCGFRITARSTCRSGTTCRRTCCRTSRW